MKKENTAIRLRKIMSDRNLRQVDILNMTVPYCQKYGVKMNKSDISQYCSGKTEPNQDKLFILGIALDVNEAWLMGFDVPMERNYFEDPTLLKRDTELEDIEEILNAAGYTLYCETYDDDYFLIKNSYNQTVSVFSDYELLTRYHALQKRGKVTAELLMSSENTFFRYLGSLGYSIIKDDPKHKPLIRYDDGVIGIEVDTLNDIKTRIDTYTKTTVDSIILKLNENELREKRRQKERLAQYLLNAAHERTDTEVNAEMQQHDDDIMNSDDF